MTTAGKSRWTYLGRLVLVAGASLGLALPAAGLAGGAKPAKDSRTTSSATLAAGQGGFVVNLDSNGRPVQAVPPAVVRRQVSSPHEGLKVEPNPAGGVMVDLKGRFQRATVAHKDAQGRVQVECVPAEALQPTSGTKE